MATTIATADAVVTRLPDAKTDTNKAVVGGRIYRISPEADRFVVITDDHAILLNQKWKRTVVPHHEMGALKAIHDAREGGAFWFLWRDNIAPDMVEGESPTTSPETTFQLGKKRWKVQGETVRFAASDGKRTSLMGYTIHHEDIGRVFKNLTQSSVANDSRYRDHYDIYNGTGAHALRMAEFMLLLYPQTHLEKGEFEEVSKGLKKSLRWRHETHRNAEWVKWGKGKEGYGVHVWDHIFMNKVALGTLYMESLRVNRGEDVSRPKVLYYSYYWNKYNQTATHTYRNLTRGDPDTQMKKIINGWRNGMTRWGRWLRVKGLERLRNTKVWNAWQNGDQIPLSPGIGGMNEAIERELSFIPDLGVVKHPESKVTIWGAEKRK